MPEKQQDSSLKSSNDNWKIKKSDKEHAETLAECLTALEDMQRKLDFLRIKLSRIQEQGRRV